MALKIAEFNSAVKLELFLNGAVIGGTQLTNPGGRVHGLDGLTLIIGAETVTFSDPNGEGYKLIDSTKSIKKAIEAATTNITVGFIDGQLLLQKVGGLTVKSTGTANRIFGFSNSSDVVGTAYAGPGGTPPMCHTIGADLDSYIALLEV